MASDRRRDADWYEQELKRQELAAARRLTTVLPADQSATGRPRPAQLAEARRVMERSLREVARLRHSLESEIERVQGRERGPQGGRRRLPPAVPRYYAVRNAIDDVIERWERRRDQLAAAAGQRPPASTPSGRRPARARR